jgi:hypothetical protein
LVEAEAVGKATAVVARSAGVDFVAVAVVAAELHSSAGASTAVASVAGARGTA